MQECSQIRVDVWPSRTESIQAMDGHGCVRMPAILMLLFASIFIKSTICTDSQPFVYLPGRHICALKRTENNGQPVYRSYCTPQLQTYIRNCGGHMGARDVLCTGYRTIYRTVYKTVYRRARSSKMHFMCCPGWEKEPASFGCLKPVCKEACQNGGRCVLPNRCKCTEGFSGRTCADDKNECKISNGGCTQTCINTVGSFKCECSDGYKLAEDGKTCTPCLECSSSWKYLSLKIEAMEKVVAGLSSLLHRNATNEVRTAELRRSVAVEDESSLEQEIKELRGEKGAKGDRGERGQRGQRGLQGPAGPKGPKGPEGAQGPPGPRGIKGFDGAQGEPGMKGEKGSPGVSGLKGEKGDSGSNDVSGLSKVAMKTLVERVALLEASLLRCGCESMTADSIFLKSLKNNSTTKTVKVSKKILEKLNSKRKMKGEQQFLVERVDSENNISSIKGVIGPQPTEYLRHTTHTETIRGNVKGQLKRQKSNFKGKP